MPAGISPEFSIPEDYPPDRYLSWGDVGHVGLVRPAEQKEIPILLPELINNLKINFSIDELVILLRHAFTQFNIYSIIQHCESILYSSFDNMILKEPYKANPLNHTYFHVLRAHANAYFERFEIAQKMWSSIYADWFQHVGEYRKLYLLNHLFISSVCSGLWKECNYYLSQSWSLIKLMNSSNRNKLGQLDEWVSMNIVHWFFMKHSAEYRDNCCDNKDYFFNGLYAFSKQRKHIILEAMNDSFVCHMIEEHYYKKAQTIHLNLPKIKYPILPILYA